LNPNEKKIEKLPVDGVRGVFVRIYIYIDARARAKSQSRKVLLTHDCTRTRIVTAFLLKNTHAHAQINNAVGRHNTLRTLLRTVRTTGGGYRVCTHDDESTRR